MRERQHAFVCFEPAWFFAPRKNDDLRGVTCCLMSATERGTLQAVKMGIPIVSEKYLLARLKAGKEIDHEPYLMTVESTPAHRFICLFYICFL